MATFSRSQTQKVFLLLLQILAQKIVNSNQETCQELRLEKTLSLSELHRVNDEEKGFDDYLDRFEREFIVHFNHILCAGSNCLRLGPRGETENTGIGLTLEGIVPEIGGSEVRLPGQAASSVEVKLRPVPVREVAAQVKPVVIEGKERDVVIFTSIKLELRVEQSIIKAEGWRKCLNAGGVQHHAKEVVQTVVIINVPGEGGRHGAELSDVLKKPLSDTCVSQPTNGSGGSRSGAAKQEQIITCHNQTHETYLVKLISYWSVPTFDIRERSTFVGGHRWYFSDHRYIYHYKAEAVYITQDTRKGDAQYPFLARYERLHDNNSWDALRYQYRAYDNGTMCGNHRFIKVKNI